MPDSSSSRTGLWILIGGAVFFIFVLAVFTLVYFTVKSEQGGDYSVTGGSGGRIAVVDIEGVIVTPKQAVKDLKKFADDDSIKAIVLHLNTLEAAPRRRKRSTGRSNAFATRKRSASWLPSRQ